jgi:membrane protease YdiL (CAAX protease family)
MFAGMAIWILILDPSAKGGASSWAGWQVRDVLLTLAAAYCLRQMAQFVWDVLLYQWELRGWPAVPPQTRNLGSAAWQMLACVVAVGAFALAPYRLGGDAVGLVPVSCGWLAIGAAVGLLSGPGLLLLSALLHWRTGGPLRFQGRQIDFLAPYIDGQFRPPLAVAGMLLLTVVLGPWAEELLFRGVVYAGLRNQLGIWVAVPLSSLIFGLAHREAGGWVVGFTSIMGMLFAGLFEGSGSLWPAVLGHALMNSKVIAAYSRSFREAVTQPTAG